MKPGQVLAAIRVEDLAPLEERPLAQHRRERRRVTSRRASTSRSAASGVDDQSSHEVGLSWQYALLFPPCVRHRSSPASSIGAPVESNNVQRKVPGLAATATS